MLCRRCLLLFIELSIMRFFCPHRSSVMFFFHSVVFCRRRCSRYSLLLMIVWCKYAHCAHLYEPINVYSKFICIHGCVPDSYRVCWSAYTFSVDLKGTLSEIKCFEIQRTTHEKQFNEISWFYESHTVSAASIPFRRFYQLQMKL